MNSATPARAPAGSAAATVPPQSVEHFGIAAQLGVSEGAPEPKDEIV